MDDKKDRTIYCGNLSDKVTEPILYELFLQAGPLECVKIPKGRNFGFVTFKHEVSVPYAVALMSGLSLYGRELRLELRSGSASQHNPYLDTILAHKHSMNHNPLGHAQPNNYIGPENCWRDSPYPPFRDNKTSLLKDSYKSTPEQNWPFHSMQGYNGLSPGAMYVGLSPSPITYGRVPMFHDAAMRTFSPPEYWPNYDRQNKILHNNHIRDRSRRY